MDLLGYDSVSIDGIKAGLTKYPYLECEAFQDGLRLTAENFEAIYYPFFFKEDISLRAYKFLTDGVVGDTSIEGTYGSNIVWERRPVKMYGKSGYLARLVSWYADQERDYVFSRVRFKGRVWNEGLSFIKNKVEKKLGESFNSVLLNYYRNGDDYISWHTDAEKSLGENPSIASVSFGSVRRFKFRSLGDKSKVFSLPLLSGSLLLMKGATQHHWQHAIDKERGAEGRVNLTFRNMK